MSSWKHISKLSDREEKKRAMEFEAEMLALLAQNDASHDPKQSSQGKNPPQISTTYQRDGIQISITENGQTKTYTNLQSVPHVVQQRIMRAWNPSQEVTIPMDVNCSLTGSNQSINESPKRHRSKQVAIALNLILPGAGQFYLGRPVVGSIYAISFLACMGAMLMAFFHAYYDYFKVSTSGEIMTGNNLERLAEVFPTVTFFSLLAIAMGIWLVATIHLYQSNSSDR